MARRKSFFKKPSLNRALGISKAKSRFTRATGGRMLRDPVGTMRQKARRYGLAGLYRKGRRSSRSSKYAPAATGQISGNSFGLATVLTIILAVIIIPFFSSVMPLVCGVLGIFWFIIYAFSQPEIAEDDVQFDDDSSDHTKQRIPTPDDVLTVHFEFQNIIQEAYRQRDKEGYLDLAIQTCYDQIEYAPIALEAFKKLSYIKSVPKHVGYEQLCIIREKQGNYEEVISLSKQAQKQGWNGSWDARIARCDKKLLKGVSTK